MSLPQTVIRPLGTFSRHALGLYRNVITVCRYQLPSSLQRDDDNAHLKNLLNLKNAVTAALAAVVLERLPTLRVGIADEDSAKPVFVTVPSLDLADHVEWVPRAPGLAADEYDRLLADDMARDNARAWPDVETRPPWRLVVYVNAADGWADVAFAVHHALGDGKSGLIFHTHLVEVLNRPSASIPTTGVLAFTTQPVLAPPQESLFVFTTTWLFFLKTLWVELVPAWLKPAPRTTYYTGPRVALHKNVLDGPLRLFHLTPVQAAALLAGCRAHATTLTALMHGLAMVLFARRIPADTASSFSCGMPISTRPAIVPPPIESGSAPFDVNRQMGNYVCTHKHVYGPDAVADARNVAGDKSDKSTDKSSDDDKVWRAAVDLGIGLKARVANLTTDNIMALMDWVSDFRTYWLQQDGKVRETTWCVSNTGAMEDGSDGTDNKKDVWRLRRNFYSQSSLGKDALVSVNVGSVRGGDMSFVVAWHRGVVEDAFAHQFADDLRDCLLRFAETGHFGVPDRL